MVLLLYSRKQIFFESIHLCPECKKLLWSPKYFKGDGTRISHGELGKIGRVTQLKQLGTIFSGESPDELRAEALSISAECPKCKMAWPVFSGGKVQKSEQESDIEVIETHRSEEPIGTEQRTIDNSKSSIELERRLTIKKDWSKSAVVEKGETKKEGVELKLGINEAASITTAAEQAISSKYTISQSTTETYTDEILLKVPGKTKLRLELNWKRIWQHGVIKILDPAGDVYEVPYKTIVGVSFDQTQIDES